MKNTDYQKLIDSVHEAGQIHKNETKPSRVFDYSPVNVKKIRIYTGLSQDDFAKLIHISKKTLQNWEQGRRHPQGPALALLAALRNDPEHVISALMKKKKKK